MYNSMLRWRPSVTPARVDASLLPLPRELHVHADGSTVATYDSHADVHFESIYEVLEVYGLTEADLEPMH